VAVPAVTPALGAGTTYTVGRVSDISSARKGVSDTLRGVRHLLTTRADSARVPATS